MTALTEKFIAAYAGVPARDLPDARFFCNRQTFDDLCYENNIFDPSKLPLAGNLAFGLPVLVDDTLQDGEVKCIVETEMDRVIRRAHEAGYTLTLPQVVFETPLGFTTVAPKPTLKALLRHWLKRDKR